MALGSGIDEPSGGGAKTVSGGGRARARSFSGKAWGRPKILLFPPKAWRPGHPSHNPRARPAKTRTHRRPSGPAWTRRPRVPPPGYTRRAGGAPWFFLPSSRRGKLELKKKHDSPPEGRQSREREKEARAGRTGQARGRERNRENVGLFWCCGRSDWEKGGALLERALVLAATETRAGRRPRSIALARATRSIDRINLSRVVCILHMRQPK